MSGGIDDETWRKRSQADWDKLAAPDDRYGGRSSYHMSVLFANGTWRITAGVLLILLSSILYSRFDSLFAATAIAIAGVAFIVTGWNREFKDSPGRYGRIRVRDDEL